MNKIQIEGKYFNKGDFIKDHIRTFFDESSTRKKLYLFLKEWFSPGDIVKLHTSGSTGKPKEILAHKSQMLQSAAMTCRFFKLDKNDKALLCLSTDYIAGKMMVVRAIYTGMNLYPVEVTGHPLSATSVTFDFAAMTPLQIYNSLSTRIEIDNLSQIKNVIVGGGSIDCDLEKRLKSFPNSIYSTYGMTETLSHIGLRKINGDDASLDYTPLWGIDLMISDNQTLIINAPHIADNIIVTNDVAEINTDGSFRIFGRIDNIINTGGIKVQIEEVEQQLNQYIKSNFAITSIPHPKLGEAVVLLIEALNHQNINGDIINEINNITPQYYKPRYIYTVRAIPMTNNGKKDRRAIKELALKSFNEDLI